jgi:hypothetical protein
LQPEYSCRSVPGAGRSASASSPQATSSICCSVVRGARCPPRWVNQAHDRSKLALGQIQRTACDSLAELCKFGIVEVIARQSWLSCSSDSCVAGCSRSVVESRLRRSGRKRRPTISYRSSASFELQIEVNRLSFAGPRVLPRVRAAESDIAHSPPAGRWCLCRHSLPLGGLALPRRRGHR